METEKETFDRVLDGVNTCNTFEIAKAYHVERKRIEGEYFTCPFSNETFKIGDKAYVIYNNELDEEEACELTIFKGDFNNNSLAYFSSHEKGIEWNHAKFKPKE